MYCLRVLLCCGPDYRCVVDIAADHALDWEQRGAVALDWEQRGVDWEQWGAVARQTAGLPRQARHDCTARSRTAETHLSGPYLSKKK
mmetsp:Transcript_21508/g.35489  ORF Transcript_21508/g.35489 Transcript_21508/m.35489 type:complete len:87 (-) Transcript_21508:265-525(-)